MHHEEARAQDRLLRKHQQHITTPMEDTSFYNMRSGLLSVGSTWLKFTEKRAQGEGGAGRRWVGSGIVSE